MNRKLFCLSLLTLAVTACSNVNKFQAEGDFDYVKNNEAKELTIPAGLQKPKQKNEYYVPEVAASNAPVGEEMDIRAPSLVIPMAASSRIEADDGEAQVWFDQVIEDQVLLDFIRNAVKSQLASDNVKLTAVGNDNLVFESDWYNTDKESGFWLFKEIEETESHRFKYTLETKPHGRSVAINVDLIDYKKTSLTDTTNDINSIEQHRAEMAMLNTLIGEVDYQYRVYSHKVLQTKAKQIDIELSSTKDNVPALLANMDLDSLWSNIPTFFRENGLEVTDLNESKYIYFTTYTKPEQGFWDSLWNDEKPTLDLAEGKYKFVFKASENKTLITIFNEQDESLPQSRLEKILPAMKTGLSFESLF